MEILDGGVHNRYKPQSLPSVRTSWRRFDVWCELHGAAQVGSSTHSTRLAAASSRHLAPSAPSPSRKSFAQTDLPLQPARSAPRVRPEQPAKLIRREVFSQLARSQAEALRVLTPSLCIAAHASLADYLSNNRWRCATWRGIAWTVLGAIGGLGLAAVPDSATAKSAALAAATSPSAAAQGWHPGSTVPASSGIAQPQSLTPRSSPYPTTKFPSFAGVIEQPQYAAPNKESTGDEVTVSDRSGEETAVEPPKLTAPLAPPRKFDPPPVAAKPAKSRRFWDFLLGPSQAPAAPASPPVAQATGPSSARATGVTAKARPALAGNSLLSQLLGTSSPPPRPSAETKLDASPLANQLLLTSAEVESEDPAAPPAERRPTVARRGSSQDARDVDDDQPARPETAAWRADRIQHRNQRRQRPASCRCLRCRRASSAASPRPYGDRWQ